MFWLTTPMTTLSRCCLLNSINKNKSSSIRKARTQQMPGSFRTRFWIGKSLSNNPEILSPKLSSKGTSIGISYGMSSRPMKTLKYLRVARWLGTPTDNGGRLKEGYRCLIFKAPVPNFTSGFKCLLKITNRNSSISEFPKNLRAKTFTKVTLWPNQVFSLDLVLSHKKTMLYL